MINSISFSIYRIKYQNQYHYILLNNMDKAGNLALGQLIYVTTF